MIKTLRITSIIAAILAGVVLVFLVVLGVRSNPSEAKIEQLLNSPGAIEKFNKAQSDKVTKDQGQSSPLVKQAQALALYLNPSQPKAGLPGQLRGMPSPIGPVTAKFTLIGTSFYEARPKESLAFIDEPGKGLRWVRPSSQIGHLTIEQIKDGLIVVRDGQSTFEMKAEQKTQKSTLLEGSPSGAASAIPASTTVPKSGTRITRGSRSQTPQLKDEQKAALEELVEKLRNMQRDIKSQKTDSGASPKEKAELVEKLISDFKATRVSDDEARKLGDLGKELKDVQQESSKTENKKVTKPAEPANSTLPKRR